jgi:predicted aspartyl protease
VQISVSDAGRSALASASQPIPAPVQALAMVDTGATSTAIQMGIAAQLGLQPVGVQTVNTPTSQGVTCDEYLVRLIMGWIEVTAIEAPLQGQHIQVLIGRDVLSHGLLIYNGANNQFTLSF